MGTQLFLGVLYPDTHVRAPGQNSVTVHGYDVQSDRVLCGEPSDGVGQIDPTADFIATSVALHVDAERDVEVLVLFSEGRTECDEQQILNVDVQSRSHVGYQHFG